MANSKFKTGKLLEPVDSPTGINQILPHRHPDVWQMFKDGINNNWNPQEISMGEDIKQWNGNVLTEDEKLLVKRCLGFFAGGESLVSNNLVLSFFRWITDAECRQYILRQAYEEANHNLTVVTCCDSYGLDIKEVYEAYESIPSIKAKDEFLMEITTDIARRDFDPYGSDDDKREFVRALITYYIVCEGILFFSGFIMLLALRRQGKLQGLGRQIAYTVRDETVHVQFGTYVINTIKKQYPDIWTPEFEAETIEHVKKAVELEILYAYDVLPNGILGLNAEMFIDYMQYLANARLESIGIKAQFPSKTNPFPWLGEVLEYKAEVNFFESRVTDYQNAGALEDDL